MADDTFDDIEEELYEHTETLRTAGEALKIAADVTEDAFEQSDDFESYDERFEQLWDERLSDEQKEALEWLE